MLIPVITLPEKSQKECSLGKQLIQDLNYSIPLMAWLNYNAMFYLFLCQ